MISGLSLDSNFVDKIVWSLPRVTTMGQIHGLIIVSFYHHMNEMTMYLMSEIGSLAVNEAWYPKMRGNMSKGLKVPDVITTLPYLVMTGFHASEASRQLHYYIRMFVS